MKTFLPALVSVIAVFSLTGCSAGNAGAPQPGGECHAVAHDGSALDMALASNPPQSPAGGTIVPGNYVLTAARLFNVPGNVTIARKLGGSLQINADGMLHTSFVDGTQTRRTSQFTTAGTSLTLVETCPGSTSATLEYTATPALLELYTVEPGVSGTSYTLESVYTKR